MSVEKYIQETVHSAKGQMSNKGDEEMFHVILQKIHKENLRAKKRENNLYFQIGLVLILSILSVDSFLLLRKENSEKQNLLSQKMAIFETENLEGTSNKNPFLLDEYDQYLLTILEEN